MYPGFFASLIEKLHKLDDENTLEAVEGPDGVFRVPPLPEHEFKATNLKVDGIEVPGTFKFSFGTEDENKPVTWQHTYRFGYGIEKKPGTYFNPTVS